MHRFLLVAISCVAIFAVNLSVNADDKKDEKKKYTVKDVMKKAMKGGLCKKVATGKASEKEVDQLIEMLNAMAAAKVKKGDEKSWKDKTKALVEAAKGVKGKTKAAGDKLAKAMNCKACHTKHK